MAEYGAEFSDRISAWIENEQVLRVNIVPGLQLKKLSYERVPHFLGIDVGLKGDGTAIAVTHIVERESCGIMKKFIELDHIDVRYAPDEGKEYFQPEEMADWIATIADKFFIVKGILDQYYGLAMLPVLHDKKGLKQIEVLHMSREMNSRIYQNLMSKMLDNSLRIPEADREQTVDGRKVKDLALVLELLKLQATVHSKYLITVEAPQTKTGHDDMSDAYGRSVYLATEYLSQGGGVKKTVADVVGGGVSYRKYLTKQKMGAFYTNRPSSMLQMEIARGKYNTSRLSRFGR